MASLLTRIRNILAIALYGALLVLTPAIGDAEEWMGWRGGMQEGRSAASGPLHWSPERNVVWKTRLPGEGYSSPIVTEEAVYVTAAWRAEPDARLLVAFRAALWGVLLLLILPALAFVLRRCGAENGAQPTLRALCGLAGTVCLLAALSGLLFDGESLLDFNRAAERPWIAVCLCGTLSLTLSSLYTRATRFGNLPGGGALLGFALALALTIPDRAHTVTADPQSDVSKLIYLVIAIPALAGLIRMFWPVSQRQEEAARPEGEAKHRKTPLLWAARTLVLLMPLAALAFLSHLIAQQKEETERTISIGKPYVPMLPGWTILLPLAVLGGCLVLRKRRRFVLGANCGLVVSASVIVLLSFYSIAEHLIAQVPYLAYLLGEPEVIPLLGQKALALFALACLLVTAWTLFRMRRHASPAPQTLPTMARLAGLALTVLYFVYAMALPHTPHLERGIVCVDRQTGAIRWLCGGIVASGETQHSDNSPATPTAVTDGERIYAYFGTPGLLCANRQGKRLWINQELPYASREGVASSPVLCQGRVIVLSESDAGSYLAGVDAGTGRLLWRTERRQQHHAFAGNCRTPTVVNVAGSAQIVVWGYADVSGYDPMTGRALWSHAVEDVGTGGNPVASATTDGIRLFLVGSYQAMCLNIGRLAGSGAFLRWRQDTGDGAQCSTPVVQQNLLVAVSDNGSAYCLDTGTGRELWRKDLEQQHYASVVATRDRLYFLGTQGRTTVVAPERVFRLLAQNDLNERLYATPAPVDGALFVRTRTHLYCLRER